MQKDIFSIQLRLFFIFLSLGLLSIRSFSQPSSPALATAVTVDLEKRTVSEIPFDKLFCFVGDIKPEWNIDKLIFFLREGRDDTIDFTQIADFESKRRKRFAVPVVDYLPGSDYLLPDREYTLKISAFDTNGKEIVDYSFQYGFLTSSKFGDHVKLDFGIGYASKLKATFGFTTVNLYFTPINDETDLQLITNFKRNIFLRSSFFFGIAPLTLSSNTKQPIKNRYGLGNFVFGVAIRSPFYGSYTPFKNKVGQKLLQPMRLKFGYLLFKQANSNPLIINDENKRVFYLGLSYDFNIAALFGPVAKIIQP